MNIHKAIQTRKTLKLRANPDKPLPITKGEEFKKTIKTLIELAGKAPFHHTSHKKYQNNKLNGFEPWRFHLLDSKNCRILLKNLKDGKPVTSSKGILQMLAAADAVILGTWLPEKKRNKKKSFQTNIKNMEHIAATGAAIQNLLLAATAKGINAYWSSGGVLRKSKTKEYLGISKEEILLGAIFIFPDTYPAGITSKPGKNREHRGTPESYMQWLEVQP